MENRLGLLKMVFLIIIGSCHAQYPNTTSQFQTNLKTLLNFLTEKAPLHDGFYETSIGNNSDRVYGVVQCKANLSSNACANCLNSSSESLLHGNGTWVESLSSLCILKYSNENFFGDWITTTLASFGDNGLDDALAYSKGFSMMEDLVTKVPDQALMYQSGDVDVGDGHGRRYGLAQCTRDLSKVNCRNCLEDELVRYRSYVENRTGWEMLGISCSMWYGNVSVTDSPDLIGWTPSDTLGSMAPTPSQTPSQSRIPPAAVTSGSQRCYGAMGIAISTSLIISILML